MIDKYVISLPGDNGRLEKFTTDNCNFTFNVHRAVRGSDIRKNTPFMNSLFSEEVQNIYSDGAIGCAASHIDIWKQVACLAAGGVNVFEDDAVLNANFDNLSEGLLKCAEVEPDLIVWGFNFDMPLYLDMADLGPSPIIFQQVMLESQGPHLKFKDNIHSLLPLSFFFGTCAYYISSLGARKLLELVLPISYRECALPFMKKNVRNIGIDIAISQRLGKIRAYVSMPPLAVTMNEKTSSTVQR